MKASDLRFATERLITALWVVVYTIDNDAGEAHIFSHTRDPGFADGDFEARWPKFRLLLDADNDVTGIRIMSPGGECVWNVSNPRGRFEYDAEALVSALLASGGVR